MRRRWPHVFHRQPALVLSHLRPGTEPVARWSRHFSTLGSSTAPAPNGRRDAPNGSNALLGRKLTLRDLLDQTERRYVELQRSEPPAFFLYIDQGEELYVRAVDRQRRCFSEILRMAG